MIEIVYSESAWGSLLAALHAAHQTTRQVWDEAVPLDIRREDVYCFDLALSVGDITGTGIGPQRGAALKALLSVCCEADLDAVVRGWVQKAEDALAAVLTRYRAGEAVRLWYSSQPDELCGMHWLLAQLKTVESQAAVFLVKLPPWETGGDGTVTVRNSWGEAEPSAWGRALSRQEPVSPALLAACAGRWRQLQEENAPLRISLNGRLQSAPTDLYDSFLLRELAAQPETFSMAALIGTVLGKYQLGISDGWLALRLEKMIEAGALEIVQEAPQGALSYGRILRKGRKETLETM